jgi:hypothetical protein
LAGAAVPALAQGWWPWSGNQTQQRPPPVPREPVYRDPGAAPPPQGQSQGGWTAPGQNSICLQLEQRLVQEGQRGNDSRTMIPAVENDLRQTEQAYRSAQRELDRGDCYEYFLFSKTLRRTKRCMDLANQADASRQRVDDLEVQLQQLQGSSGQSYQDEIVRELARNNCGSNYQQQAKRQDGGGSNFWDDEESSSGGGATFGALPYATYKTVCVRLCDGYYFPISFSTLPNHFQRDENVCQSKCAAPAELYYHQNPGGGMDQAMGARTNTPYTQLKEAYRYRKEYVAGCSCKVAEYKGEPGAPQAQNQGGAAPGGVDGWSTAEHPTGSTTGQESPQAAAPAQPPPVQGGGETLPWNKPQ